MTRTKRIILTVALSLLAIIALLGGAASVTAFAFQERVSPRTIIAGNSIGSYSRIEATKAILQKQAELAKQSLTISYNDDLVTIPLTEMGVKIVGPTVDVVNPSLSSQNWLRPDYWQRFFALKRVGLKYELDEETIKAVLEKRLGVSTVSQDAKLEVKDGQLVVVEAKRGESLATTEVIKGIEALLDTGSTQKVTVSAVVVEPTVSSEAANRTKGELEATFIPIYLAGEGRSFTISVAQLYDLVTYEVKDGELKWQLTDEKLSGYISSKIASRLNVKMIQKHIQSDTKETVQEGRDGKSVDTNALIASVRQTITEQIPTKGSPITIPISTIAFTEKTVDPEYVAGLFEGLYVDINLSKQKLFIMNGTTKVSQHLISSGKRGTPTPVGLFYIKNKIELAQSRLYPGIWMRRWNALSRNPDGSGYEGYGIHDLPAFNAEYTLVEGESHLGQPVSHGCVRLGHDAAVWFYDNIPVATPVNIHL